MINSNEIKSILTEKLNAEYVAVVDDSALHAGHQASGAGGHFSVVVVSDVFADQSLVQCHRLVNDALKDELKEKIHALAIKTFTPEQWQEK